jgi:hypothetical protein
MKQLVYFLIIILIQACVQSPKSNRKLVTPTPVITNPIVGCNLNANQPVCALSLVDDGNLLYCIQAGPGCGQSTVAYAKVNFANACIAQRNGAFILHQGTCNPICTLEVPIPPAGFCSGGETFLDYNSAGCMKQFKCRDFPCPQISQLAYVEPCSSGLRHTVYESAGECHTLFSCQNSACPSERPIALPTNCSNTGHYNATYNSNACLQSLTCAN